MNNQPLRVFISAVAARGHLNCAIGFGDLLKKRGHTILFAQREAFRDLIESHGFELVPFDEEIFENEKVEPFNEWTRINSHIFRKDGIERFRNLTPLEKEQFSGLVGDRPLVDKALAKIFREVPNIDVIITDLVNKSPSIHDSGIPSVEILSLSPLILYPNGVPPYAGFNTKIKDQAKFDDYIEIYRDAWSVISDIMKKWFRSAGKDDWADEFDPWNFVNCSVDLGFYHYAEDMDYHELGAKHPNWYRIDFCVRESKKSSTSPQR